MHIKPPASGLKRVVRRNIPQEPVFNMQYSLPYLLHLLYQASDLIIREHDSL
jgi:hypothetical protein